MHLKLMCNDQEFPHLPTFFYQPGSQIRQSLPTPQLLTIGVISDL